MNEEYEEILAELTETQRNVLVRWVQANMRPNDAADEDVMALLRRDLLEFSEPMHHKESYSGSRVSSPTGGGVIGPSDLGREWVKWYLARP